MVPVVVLVAPGARVTRSGGTGCARGRSGSGEAKDLAVEAAVIAEPDQGQSHPPRRKTEGLPNWVTTDVEGVRSIVAIPLPSW
ncbi:MAG: hypothetical protein MPW15_09385 [Candidatus Manganitrophus sp.]|nr:hypothetical protein [Candidatus Manganitrophus sp.]